MEKAYGSGHFGEWIEDEYGLPAYRYTCNQVKDPKAVTVTNEFWRKPTDHSHQVGNDRLVAVASNYGYVQVRQDEGGPKFLNDYCPEEFQFGGGIGYLVEGKQPQQQLLTTFFTGDQPSFDRVFGIGYYRKKVSANSISVDQVIFAPFGDDPLVISKVSITNNRKDPADVGWIEYWGCQQYQFSYKAFMRSFTAKKDPPHIRREFARRFHQGFRTVGENEGIVCDTRFQGYTFGDKLNWGILNVLYATVAKRITGGAVKPPVKEAAMEDVSPPRTFLVSLDAPADGTETNAQKFFGKGGVQAPDGLSNHLPAVPNTYSPAPQHVGLFIQRNVVLQPGETKTMFFAFGYLTANAELDGLCKKYKRSPDTLLEASCKQWKAEGICLDIPGEPWIAREMKWHSYYLRGNLTYDSYFKEHILSQGHVYQYLIGFQGASRDPLQHVLPFIYSDPKIVKEIIRYTLKTTSEAGKIPYGITGAGMVLPSFFNPSDLELWLLWVASEYVLAAKDTGFLEETVNTYPVYGPKARARSVKDMLLLCHDHLMMATGPGEHGLLRISNGDWNDMVIHGYVPRKQVPHVEKVGESVLNTAMASYVLALFARALAFAGEVDRPSSIQKEAESFQAAVRGQWCGKWFKRAWLGEKLGWIGEDTLWLEPQPWAILGGSAGRDEVSKLVASINKESREPSRLGAMILNKPVAKASEQHGTGTNAGVWYSINGTLVWALSRVDPRAAWDEWTKNSLANHAEQYPDVWYGIWSAPDCVNSGLSKNPGMTIFIQTRDEKEVFGFGSMKVNWTDFPVMNMHPHAWPLINTAHLLGISFGGDGVIIAPSIPFDEYEFKTSLLGLRRTRGSISGWYTPQKPGTWSVSIQMNPGEAGRCKSVEINGKVGIYHVDGGYINFAGMSSQDSPLSWKIPF